MRPDLSSVRGKLDRAQEHIEALHEAGNGFLDAEPYRFEHQYSPYLSAYFIWVTPLKQPPPELSILLGDALYNCGSALDHIICALARLTNPTSKCHGTQFPIFTTPKGYGDAETKYLRGVPPKAKTVIKRLQPFVSKGYGVDPKRHVLEVFRTLYNTDKHRRLNVALSAVHEARYTPNNPMILPIGDPYAGLIKGRTKLVQFTVPRGVTGQVRVDADISLGISLDEGEPGLWPDDLAPSLSEGVQSIHYWISEEVLPKFERSFDPLP